MLPTRLTSALAPVLVILMAVAVGFSGSFSPPGRTALSTMNPQQSSEECTPHDLQDQSDQLQMLFSSYISYARDYGKRKRYRDAKTALMRFMSEVIRTPCGERTANDYVQMAFHHMTPILEKGKSTRTAQERKTAIVGILARLNQRGNLRPLTPSIREKFGGAWNERASNSDQPRILAAYDCLQTMIWYDPLLPPLNLGAVIAHEMDHLLRDKITFGEQWQASQRRASLEELFIFDEVMANIIGALSQFRIHTDSNRDYAFQRKRKTSLTSPRSFGELPVNQNYERYGIRENHDLNLFSKSGALSRIWEHLFQQNFGSLSRDEKRQTRKDIRNHNHGSASRHLRAGQSVISSYGDEEGIPIFGGYRPLLQELLVHEALPDLEAIVGLVARVYFPRTEIDRARIARMIQRWIAEQNPDEIPSPFADALSLPSKSGREDYSHIVSLFDSPSAGCNSMRDAMENGSFEGYLSPNDPKENPSGGGVQPTLPTPPGGVPSGEGVRPSTMIKACVWPTEQL